jgi:hypothetical protein
VAVKRESRGFASTTGLPCRAQRMPYGKMDPTSGQSTNVRLVPYRTKQTRDARTGFRLDSRKGSLVSGALSASDQETRLSRATLIDLEGRGAVLTRESRD